jgi:hypothetical protein
MCFWVVEIFRIKQASNLDKMFLFYTAHYGGNVNEYQLNIKIIKFLSFLFRRQWLRFEGNLDFRPLENSVVLNRLYITGAF